MTPPSVADSLLVHASFVQQLARSLAGQDGDDLAQETFVAAMVSGGGGVRSARSWLATIAANLWRNRRRGDARRLRRERDHGATAAPSIDAILQREELRRQVVAAVVALPERLRTVVLLRYFEGLDSAAIGAQLGVPASTVRTQLQQALAQLRRQLDGVHGERRGWIGLVGALGAAGELARVSWPMRSAGALVAAALLAWWALPWWNGGGPVPQPPPLGPIEVVADVGQRTSPPAAEPAAARDVAEAAAVAAAPGREVLWGRVIDDATDAPVAGAELALEHRDADEMTNLDLEYGQRIEVVGSARTDAEGRFRFRVSRALQYRLRVRAAGYASELATYRTGGPEQVVRLARAAFVEGVVRRTDGRPLDDVEVTARVRGSTGDGESTKTAADGSFYLSGIGSKPTYVSARPKGLLEPQWQLVELVPGQGRRLEFVVEPGRTLRGVVHTEDGDRPLADAAVALSRTMSGAVRTGADGSYTIEGVGYRQQLHVRADGHADLMVAIPDDGDPVVVDVTMQRGEAVTGRIVDAAGAPIATSFVAAGANQSPRGGMMHTFWRTGTVAADGRFRVEGIGRTYRNAYGATQLLDWQLLVRAAGHGARAFAIPLRQLQPGDRDLGDLVLPEQALLEGRIVDAAGGPVADAEVALDGVGAGFDELLAPGAMPRPAPLWHFGHRSTRSGSDGSYCFAGIAPGSYSLTVHPDGKDWDVSSGPHAVAAAGAVVTVPDIVVDAGLTIAGRVPNAPREQVSVGSFSIQAMSASGAQGIGRVAADGSFRIERLEAGDYLLTADTPPAGWAIAPLRGIAAGTVGLELALVPAVTIEGRVVDADGKPFRGATVTFWPPGLLSARNVRTDAEGRFRIEAAPGVVGRLLAQDPGRMLFGSAQLEDVAAGTSGLELRLPK